MTRGGDEDIGGGGLRKFLDTRSKGIEGGGGGALKFFRLIEDW